MQEEAQLRSKAGSESNEPVGNEHSSATCFSSDPRTAAQPSMAEAGGVIEAEQLGGAVEKLSQQQEQEQEQLSIARVLRACVFGFGEQSAAEGLSEKEYRSWWVTLYAFLVFCA